MAGEPVAYFITFSTYGTWLHGREDGSVDREHNAHGAPLLPADVERRQYASARMSGPAYVLNVQRRTLVIEAIQAVCDYRGWTLFAAHARTNHVHVVVAGPAPPEKMMADFKTYASRRLNDRLNERTDGKRWTRHGSTLYLWNETMLAEKIDYTIHRQGEPMAVYQRNRSEPER